MPKRTSKPAQARSTAGRRTSGGRSAGATAASWAATRSGSESDAGYRVALSVCQALRRNALARAAARQAEGLIGLAAL